jgi:hypothetical protein
MIIQKYVICPKSYSETCPKLEAHYLKNHNNLLEDFEKILLDKFYEKTPKIKQNLQNIKH